MSQAAADGRGPVGIVRSPFFLKVAGFVVLLILAGIATPPLFPDNEFVGVFVGMVWSVAFLIVAVMVIAVVGSAVRQALR
ncbi:hypothetical protein [Halorarius litoreus]|uniref:hypothetical protein n=1 Tax=Halorarius litoreus TaxID=2962676 RepID=UPI0020CDCD39|nr:hypothetical protein [Halorarius litoreus]